METSSPELNPIAELSRLATRLTQLEQKKTAIENEITEVRKQIANAYSDARSAISAYQTLGIADSGFTKTETRVFRLLARGLSNKEIANEIGGSERTIKFHVSNLLTKTRCSGRAELIAQKDRWLGI